MANPTPQEVRESAAWVIRNHVETKRQDRYCSNCDSPWPCGELIQARNALAMAEMAEVAEARARSCEKVLRQLVIPAPIPTRIRDAFDIEGNLVTPAPSAPTREAEWGYDTELGEIGPRDGKEEP